MQDADFRIHNSLLCDHRLSFSPQEQNMLCEAAVASEVRDYGAAAEQQGVGSPPAFRGGTWKGKDWKLYVVKLCYSSSVQNTE